MHVGYFEKCANAQSTHLSLFESLQPFRIGNMMSAFNTDVIMSTVKSPMTNAYPWNTTSL